MKRILLISPNGNWEVEPVNTLATVPLGIILAYILFAAFRFIGAIIDTYSDAPIDWVIFPWRSKRKPNKTPLIKTQLHLFAGAGLLALYLYLGGEFGWIDFIKQQ